MRFPRSSEKWDWIEDWDAEKNGAKEDLGDLQQDDWENDSQYIANQGNRETSNPSYREWSPEGHGL